MELKYLSILILLCPVLAFAQTTSIGTPTIFGFNGDPCATDFTFSDVGNADVADGSFANGASDNGTSGELGVMTFSYSETIADDAIIDSIIFEIKGWVDGGATLQIDPIDTSTGNCTGVLYSTPITIPASNGWMGVVMFPGYYATATPALVNNPNFGYGAWCTTTADGTTISLDAMDAKVVFHSSAPSAKKEERTLILQP